VLKKRYPEAIRHLERAVETLRNKLGPDHPNVGHAQFSLGEAELAMGRPERAVAAFEHTLALRLQHEVDPSDIAGTRFALARALHAMKDTARARELAETAELEYTALAPRGVAELARVRAWLKKN
jgi:tetratricopeptide (TPR) repeat protein